MIQEIYVNYNNFIKDIIIPFNMADILINGLNYTTGKLLVDKINEYDFSDRILNSLTKRTKEFQSFSDKNKTLETFRGVQQAIPDLDKNNPKEVGWTYIINKNNTNKQEIINIIKTLAEFRGMVDPENPLMYNGEKFDKWNDWMMENVNIPGSKTPYYILIIGDPNEQTGIPFEFQSFLGMGSTVGRLDFDSLEDLSNYVTKVIRLEKLNEAVVNKEIISFATDEGYPGPTFYSKLFLAEPLSEDISKFGYNVNKIFGNYATKENLTKNLSNTNPAMVFTASHGLSAHNESFDTQKEINGAICCQKSDNEVSDDGWIYSSRDIPNNTPDRPFLEGSVFVQFACYGAGTPKESIFNKWFDEEPKLYTDKAFTASLPKKLLSHPRGPIAFIGHVDVAFLHGFDNPDNPDMPLIKGQQWDPRIRPFLSIFETILKKYQPTGRSLDDMSKRLAFYSNVFATRAEQITLDGLPLNSALFKTQVADQFIMRNDSNNYLILGDPAVRIMV